MELSFLFSACLFTLLAIFLVTALFFNNNTSAFSSSSGSTPSKSDHTPEGSLSQYRRKEVNAGLVKSGQSVHLKENLGNAGFTSVHKSNERHTENRSVRMITDPVLAYRDTVSEGRDAAEVKTCGVHEDKLSVKQCLTINPASAPVDIPVRDVGHLQFPEGPSFLCPFSYEQTLATTEIPEDSNNMKEVDIDSGPLKYVPGMLRTSQLEKMMTKEELEEEQRVQREQLAAIFQLLKENQETFGDVSEGDMEEQLRLYNI
ncbi:serine and arginine rich splicing factor 2a isoform X1 [Esox lucius]|uniref:Matrix-remodeling-associated protein 7 helical domain-containing protein n=1 Tax=Esox lucius TaxID=8010 RepID=A0A3P9ANJ9_ESOLU|nr:serine and arginine rich splicing factor 2a isoform X1 [Esox lucius]